METKITRIQNFFIFVLCLPVFILTFSMVYSDNEPVEKKYVVSTPEVRGSFVKVSRKDELISKDAGDGESMYVNTKSKESYWATLINIESMGGKLRYRPSSKGKACTETHLPCGTHQLSLQALVDFKCTPIKKCMADRDNYQKSQIMAHKYDLRLTQLGCKLQKWERYTFCWQQGVRGGRYLLEAKEGKRELTNARFKAMADNSPWTWIQLKSFGSKKAANKFYDYKRNLWIEKMVSI